jgi:hypothetical protein
MKEDNGLQMVKNKGGTSQGATSGKPSHYRTCRHNREGIVMV